MTTGQVLDPRALGRATLARQLLLPPGDGPVMVSAAGTSRVLTALDAVAGLQGQSPNAPYVALWSRLRDFDPADLTAALLSRQAVRLPLMRGTVHLVTARDAQIFRPLVQVVLDRAFESQQFARNIAGVDRERLLAIARDATIERPLTRVELGRILSRHWPDHDTTSLVYAVTFLMPAIQAPPRGVWGASAAPSWTPLDHWLDGRDGREEFAEFDGVAELDLSHSAADRLAWLFLRYLAAFGPASVRDVQAWSGLTRMSEIADRLRPQLRVFRDDGSRELFDLGDAIFPDPEVDVPPRFLGEYDNVLLAYADRRRVNPFGYSVPLFPGNGAKKGTVLVDGAFVATWSLINKSASARSKAVAATSDSALGSASDPAEDSALNSALEITLLRPISPRETEPMEHEARRLLAFLSPDADDPNAGNREIRFVMPANGAEQR
ncbi:MAG TPA: winged helix DNA-binding domain-containing protein [Nitrolancea sp.]|nr:winged helix DNA-binding domain-containing protein [Nitrolancea sp.]